jgi:hypothetical protein
MKCFILRRRSARYLGPTLVVRSKVHAVAGAQDGLPYREIIKTLSWCIVTMLLPKRECGGRFYCMESVGEVSGTTGQDCVQHHRYTVLFTSAPLNKLAGAGSMANRLAAEWAFRLP